MGSRGWSGFIVLALLPRQAVGRGEKVAEDSGETRGERDSRMAARQITQRSLIRGAHCKQQHPVTLRLRQ
jgi:hypothetical protein